MSQTDEMIAKSDVAIEDFKSGFGLVSLIANTCAKEHGWWEGERNDGELIALMHAELSEGLEALRNNIDGSEHIPEFSGIEEELADVVIRIMDYAQQRGLNIADAIIEKIKFNSTREHKHGGKNF